MRHYLLRWLGLVAEKLEQSVPVKESVTMGSSLPAAGAITVVVIKAVSALLPVVLEEPPGPDPHSKGSHQCLLWPLN